MSYPEPFIASASFMHTDLWFIHILTYQYWLWFVFCFLIIFFFVSFLIAVRWTTLRNKPRRETRGVSRSKCGDLITATVPVSWATSIIVSESTDAIDYFDGFGTTELILGIRAYQWGWEYYYPKEMEITHNIPTSYSRFIGNSIQYNQEFNLTSSRKYLYKILFTQNHKASNNNFLINFIYDKNLKNISINSMGKTMSNEHEAFLYKRANNKLPISSFLINSTLSDTSYILNKSFYNSNIKLYLGNNKSQIINNNFLNSSLYNNFLKKVLPNSNNKNQFEFNLPIYNFNDEIVTNYDIYNIKKGTITYLDDNVMTLFEKNINTSLNKVYIYFMSKLNLPYWNFFKYANYDFLYKPEYKDFNKNYTNINLFNPEYIKLSTTHVFHYRFFVWSKYFKEIVIEENRPFRNFHKKHLLRIRWDNLPIDYLNLYFNGNFIFNSNRSTTFLGYYHSFLSIPTNYNFFDSYLVRKSLMKPLNLNIGNIYNNTWINLISNYLLILRTFKFDYSVLLDDYCTSLNSINYNFLNSNLNYNNYEDSYNIRESAKTMSTNFASLGKVMKNRYDDGGSTLLLRDINNNFTKIPYFTNKKFNYDLGIGKDNINFSLLSLPIYHVSNNFQNSYMINHDMYTNFLQPIWGSLKNDMTKFSWIDWFSRWGYSDVQPSTGAKYNVIGLPFFNKLFNFNKNLNIDYQFLETYTLRIVRSRGSYLDLCNTTNNTFLKLLRNFNLENDVSLLDKLIYESLFLTRVKNNTNVDIRNSLNLNVYPVSSDKRINIGNSSILRNNISKTSLNEFVNILSKRDYFINNLIKGRGYKILSVRDYSNKNRNEIMSNVSKILHSDIDNNKNIYLTNTFLNLKDQYKPMRRGINSLIRLHATGAIAIPSEMRIQIVASSKDVIHSWAIPSAGIKIDCVPGYSSHRVFIFLVSGICWGQCMEVCGRYHHWMPIIAYFMKRDLFILWCNHFIFYDKNNNKYTSDILNQNYLNRKINLPTKF